MSRSFKALCLGCAVIMIINLSNNFVKAESSVDIIAQDDFSKYTANTVYNTVLADTVNGWASGFCYDRACNNPSTYSFKEAGVLTGSNAANQNILARKLVKPIDTTINRDYYLKWDMWVNGNANGNQVRAELSRTNDGYGNTFFSIWNPGTNPSPTGTMIPYLRNYGTATSSTITSPSYAGSTWYTVIVRVNSKAVGSNTVYQKVFLQNGTEGTTWDINASTTTKAIYDVFSVYGSTSSWKIDNIMLESYDQSLTEPAEAAVNTLAINLNSETFNSAQEIVNSLPDGVAKNSLNNRLKKFNPTLIANKLSVDSLLGNNASVNDIKRNLSLPTEVDGLPIAWSSNNTNFISNTGVITRPADGVGNQTVTMTMSINKDGVVATRNFAFTVIQNTPVAPVATNVKIVLATVPDDVPANLPLINIGAVIKVIYDYFDDNNDFENGSIYSWWSSTTPNGEKSLILDDSGQPIRTKIFTLTNAFADKYLTFSVIPKNLSATLNEGVESFSNVITTPREPLISNLSISSTIEVGTPIMVTYQYVDFNNEQENGSYYKFLVGSSPSGPFVPAAGQNSVGTTTSLTGAQYTLDSQDYGKYLVFEITPKRSALSPYEGQKVSTNPVLLPARPIATDVVITGVANVDSTLKASYKFTDANGDLDYGTRYKWCSSSTTTGFTPISGAENIGYKVTDNDVGRYIAVEVTPATLMQPNIGKAVMSAPIFIARSVGSGKGGSGKGTSYNVSANFAVEATKGVTIKPLKLSEMVLNPRSFSDVSEHWAQKDIELLAGYGVIKGVSEKEFNPESNISRAEFIALITRITNIPNSSYKGSFYDIASNDWYANNIQSVIDAGIVSDKSGAFRPTEPATRSEMADIIVKSYEYIEKKSAPSGDTLNFGDNEIILTNVYKDSIAKSVGLGIMKGTDGKFEPNQNATRAQAVTILKRLIDIWQ